MSTARRTVTRVAAPLGVRMAIADFGGTGVDLSTLPRIARALTKQAQLHFALPPPYGYGVGATIRVAKGPRDVKKDEWAIGLLAEADHAQDLGFHDQTPDGQPFMQVFPILDRADGGVLSSTISHEVCECLADPNGARASQWKDGKFWAYEVCDAVEEDAYEIDGVPVSNFCLPSFFEPVKDRTDLKLDWMGLCKSPLVVRPGGYGQYYDTRKGWVDVEHPSKPRRAYRRREDGRAARRRMAFGLAV
jgi:hypothetical protein